MAKDFNSVEDSNRSANTDIHQVSDPAKRISLQWLAGLSLLAHMGAGKAQSGQSNTISRLNFQAIPPSLEDFV
ncbi:MAG: PhoX family phosphatase, partial [Burkholderiales bacterium]